MFGLRFYSVRTSAVFLAAMALAFVSIAGGAEAQDRGRPRLGVSLRDLSPDTAHELGVPIPGGLEVGRVSRDSPAKAAGIIAGDIIFMAGGRKVLDTPALMEAMERARPGKPVRISLLRRGEVLHLEVNLSGGQAAPEPTPVARQAEAPREPAPARTPRASGRQTEAPRAPAADKPWLGVSTSDLTPEETAELHLDKPGGAKVVSVEKDSPLDEMGVQTGDVIVKLDGRPVKDSQALDTLLAGKRPGTRVMLSYVREGNTRYLAIKLGQLPDTGGSQREADTEPAPAPSAGPADAEKAQEAADRAEPAGNTLFGAPADAEPNRQPENTPSTEQ
jgi:S1-C subfamily serine protease